MHSDEVPRGPWPAATNNSAFSHTFAVGYILVAVPSDRYLCHHLEEMLALCCERVIS